MKFSIFATLLFSSTATAFSPSSKRATSIKTGNGNNKAVFMSDVAQSIDQQRSLYDPLGLYPKNSFERQNGLIQPLESSAMDEKDTTVIDPLSIYPDKSEVSSDAKMSVSLPFLKRPEYLDGSLPGDRGFDPFNLASGSSPILSLDWQRQAEIKHARLAMLAAIGWPLAELFHKTVASVTGLNSILVEQGDRVPSILNGGLSQVPLAFWIAALGAAAMLETARFVEDDSVAVSSSSSESKMNYPGDYGFDPLGLGGKSNEEKFYMQESELFHGRLGMLAITVFALQEWWNHLSVVHQLPF